MGLNIIGIGIESSNRDVDSSLYRVWCCTMYGQRVRLQNMFYFHFLHEEKVFSCVFFRSLSSRGRKKHSQGIIWRRSEPLKLLEYGVDYRLLEYDLSN